ncbi:MAG: response regulator [Halioglobus sp.]
MAQLGPVSALFFEPQPRADITDIPLQTFEPISNDFVRFESNRGSYWLRFELANEAVEAATRIISFDFPHIVAAHLYRYENGGMIRVAAHAAQMPLSQRLVVNRYPSLMFEVPGGATSQFYLNIRLHSKANQALEYQMRLYPVADFFSGQLGSLLVLTGFVGFMVALLIYNLVLYTRVGIRGYLYYSLYLVAQIVGLAAFEGLFYLLPSPPSVSTVVVLITITPMLCCYFLIHFGRDILELKRNMPVADRAMLWASYLLLVMMIAAASGIAWVNLPMELVGVVSILALVVLALMMYRRGSRAALYFAIAFAFLVLGYSTELLLYSVPVMTSGDSILSAEVVLWMERYFYYTCAAIEMVLLSVALATFIVEIRDEKDRAQGEALKNLRERERIQNDYSAQLEKDIAAGTKEIVEQSELLEKQAAELLQMDEVKSRFFANLSHEFKTPLTLIRGPVQGLLDGRYGELEPDGREILEVTARNVDRLHRLINELLVLSELESGSLILDAAEHDLNEFCRRTAALFVHTASEREITFDMQLAEGDTPVFFDEEKLEKALCNLLSNAFKYSPSGSHVRLSIRCDEQDTRSTGSFVSLVVEDEGPGVSASEQEQIFNRFYRAQSAHEQSLEGSGIGLALVKELVELHGGHVAVASPVSEQGSRFTISLPMGTAHLSIEELASETLSEPGVRLPVSAVGRERLPGRDEPQPTVLVVEDNADMRAYLVAMLAPSYRVLDVANGALALEVLEKETIELVLSDVMMPELDGLGLLTAIRQHKVWAALPVILLTARTDDENRLQALRARADDFLAKPFNAQELLLKIENLLARRTLVSASPDQGAFLPQNVEALSSSDQAFLAKATEIVQANMAEHAFDVAALAEALHMSQSTLRRRLDQSAAQTPAEFIRYLRLAKAHHYVESRHFRTIAETAHAVGFNQPGYFSRLYKQYVASLNS